MATPQDLLSALANAYSLTETHFHGDPEYVEAIEKVREFHKAVGWLVVRVEPEGFIVREEVISDSQGGSEGLRRVMEAAGIQELRLQMVPDPDVLEEFLCRLHPSFFIEGDPASVRFRGLEEHLGLSFHPPQSGEVSPTGLPGMVGGVQGLFQGFIPAVQEGAPAALDSVGGIVMDASAEPVPAPGGPSPRQVLGPEMVEEVRNYLGSYDLLRAESEARLRDEATRLTGTRNVAALSELVELLAESAGSEALDEEAVELAQELTTPAAASYVVARLGAAGTEEERARLARVLSGLGEEGAVALAHALGESRDRSERRAFLDAMVVQGPLAVVMAQKMVEDPRWFVVRNGVSVLGELGGEDAAAHLTATLANGDSRVRKETIHSLAKVGGTDAETLLLGMLEDGEGEVRSAACRALGTLGSHRAYRPLLPLLEDDSQDVQIEALQALGQIGDPGAVQLIEKKALGRWFSRPPREVRVAAFRALASIGTARALKSVGKGAKDRDPAVKAVARVLMAEN